MSATPETIAERRLRVDRLAALVYGVATQDLPMCPPWCELYNEQKDEWRAHIVRALKGEHEYFSFHEPDRPTKPDPHYDPTAVLTR